MEKWFEAHGYDYIKTKDGGYYWLTNATCGRITRDGHIRWYPREKFFKIKEKYS
jgi:hypothetical protein